MSLYSPLPRFELEEVAVRGNKPHGPYRQIDASRGDLYYINLVSLAMNPSAAPVTRLNGQAV